MSQRVRRLMIRLLVLIVLVLWEVGCARCPGVQRDLDAALREARLEAGSLRHPDTRESPHVVVDLEALPLQVLAAELLREGLAIETRRRATLESTEEASRSLLSAAIAFTVEDLVLEGGDEELHFAIRASASPGWEVLRGSERLQGAAAATVIGRIPIDLVRDPSGALDLRMRPAGAEVDSLELDTGALPRDAHEPLRQLLLSQWGRLLDEVEREAMRLLRMRPFTVGDLRLDWSPRELRVVEASSGTFLRVTLSTALYPERAWTPRAVEAADAVRVQLHPDLPAALLRAAASAAVDVGSDGSARMVTELRPVADGFEAELALWDLRVRSCGVTTEHVRWDVRMAEEGARVQRRRDPDASGYGPEGGAEELLQALVATPALILGSGDRRRIARGDFAFASDQMERRASWEARPGYFSPGDTGASP